MVHGLNVRWNRSIYIGICYADSMTHLNIKAILSIQSFDTITFGRYVLTHVFFIRIDMLIPKSQS